MANAVVLLNTHGDLLRMPIASPGNNFSLGAVEAPPAIMSTYFDEDLIAYLEAFRNDKDATYVPGENMLSIGVKDISAIMVLPPRTATTRPARA